MIPRVLTAKLRDLSKRYPVLAVLGPRQSGKTTLVKFAFPSLRYVSLEDPDIREYATRDPRSFLRDISEGAILDEAQRVPILFSYLQSWVEEHQGMGRYVLTGSQNFLMMEGISQSLAGRVAVLKLLPFSLAELAGTEHWQASVEEFMFRGLFPAIYDRHIEPADWYRSYIETYLERDVRQLRAVGDLDSFQRFLRMCASRTSQLVNLSSLASDCGVSHNTAKAWLSVLEASFLVYLSKPFHRNYGKRLVKTPKLYFTDPGLVCALQGITRPEQLETHFLRGALFETLVVSEILKYQTNRGRGPDCSFWRDQHGREVDCLLEEGGRTTAIEIKAGRTPNAEYFTGLGQWRRIAGPDAGETAVVYAGDSSQNRSAGRLVSWSAIESLFEFPSR